MKLIVINILLLITCLLQAQEYPIEDVLYTDMLEFKSEKKALEVQEKLWQVGVEVEVQEGYLEKSKRYYIELQDVSILDIEVKQDGEFKRWFCKNLKKKLIKVVFEI